MTVAGARETSPLGRWRWLVVGLAAWVAVGVVTWPSSPTFLDEVGYIGQARMLLHLDVRPVPASPGVWVQIPGGVVAKYPLFLPIVLAPLLACGGRAVFLLSFVSAVALALLAASVLDRWRCEPLWGLLVLAHPSVVLLSRTAMADLPLCALALGAWVALDTGSRRWCAGLFALLVLIKPTGIPIAAALLVGELWRARRGERGTGARSTLGVSLAGAGVGLLVVAGLNVLATGGPWYGYAWAHQGRAEFALDYLSTSGWAHLRTLLCLPPGLALGFLVLWGRRARGAALAAALLTGLMSLYWFVDTVPGPLVNLAVAPRLILPAVVFLLLGYADGIAGLLRRPALRQLVAIVLVVAAPVMALAVGERHRRQQRPLLEARRAAERLHAALDAEGPLGLTFDAMKAGVLSGLDAERFVPGAVEPCVVLCSTRSSSYRHRRALSCGHPGYRTAERVGRFRVLTHEGCLKHIEKK